MMNLIHLKLLTGTVAGGREEKNVFQFLYKMFDFSLANVGTNVRQSLVAVAEQVSPALWVAGAHSGIPNLANLALELQCDCLGYAPWEQIRAKDAQHSSFGRQG